MLRINSGHKESRDLSPNLKVCLWEEQLLNLETLRLRLDL